MSHTQHTVNGAIKRSISHNEIVNVRLSSTDNIQAAYQQLISDILAEDYDYVDVTGTLREVWGQDGEGNSWRVHITQECGSTRA